MMGPHGLAVPGPGGSFGLHAAGRVDGGNRCPDMGLEDGLIAVDIAERQCNEAPLALPVLARTEAAVGRSDDLLADKRFDSDEIRGACLEEHDALPVIPNRKNRTDPWPWDQAMKEAYKQRNRVERASARAKPFRRYATRYEKLRDVFLGLGWPVFGFIHVKKGALSVNTPYVRHGPPWRGRRPADVAGHGIAVDPHVPLGLADAATLGDVS